MLSDSDLLATVRQERIRSIGFGEAESGELTAAREKALQYYKGEMRDVTAPANRSNVVDTAVADAIETVLPDVMEVFIGGDDVATFIPSGAQDEKAAQEESDYVGHVVMQENDGFLNLYTAFKDALLTRTGIFHWWWEDEEKPETRHTLPPEQAPLAPQAQALNDALGGDPLEAEEQEDGSVNLNATVKTGRVCVSTVAPEDFTVAFDTTSDLQATTYCAMRDRPRVQDLIKNGLDAKKVRDLPAYVSRNDPLNTERDEAGENANLQDGTSGDLRVVEIRYHYIRLLEGDEKVIWKVTTDGQEAVLLDKEQVERIPFAAVTPYLVPHRFYGESVADKLIEVQKIKTVLMRSHLDGIYFALNQRNYVDMTKANEFTIPDLLRNAPGVPVRGNGEGAVTPLAAGGLNIDTLAALEYVETVAEKRSGIVRNAQGLNPDTLHDTKGGALALIAAAQKRVRMIARILAETGIKDLWLGVHAMLRSGYTEEHSPAKAKLRGKWNEEIRPDAWAERKAMTIHVGVGSAGRDHDLMVATQRLDLMQKTVELQGGLHGPILTPPDVYAAVEDWERASGSKRGDTFWTDPSAPPDPNNPPPEPPPNPEMMKVQAQIQGAQAKQQSEAQIAQQRQQFEQQQMASKAQADDVAAARDFQLQQQRIDGELALKRDEMVQKAQLERWEAEQAIQLQREEAAATVELKREEIRAKARVGTDVDSATDELPGGDG